MDYHHPMYVHCPLFTPFVTGEEVCRSLGAVNDHVLAVVQKGREVYEIHLDHVDIRDRIEVEGLTIRGRTCEVSPRFPGGTWVRVRGLPLSTPDAVLDNLLSPYGEVIVKTTPVTWRNTAIKTGDRTIKIKILKDIPGKIKTEYFGWISLRYKDQPELCFTCGQAGHQQWECEESGKPSYATVVERVGQSPNPTPTTTTTPTPTIDATFASPTLSSVETSTDEDGERKKKKKEKKDKKERREEREKKERKRDLSSDTTTPEKDDHVGKHEGLPTMIPTMKHVDKRKK